MIAFSLHAYVRFRNNMSMRFHTTILCVFECEKTCILRFYNTSVCLSLPREPRHSYIELIRLTETKTIGSVVKLP